MEPDSSRRSDCRYLTWVGAYLLGALTVADRASFVPHVGTCRECRDEIVALAGLPGLLFRALPDAGPPGGQR